MNIDLNRDYELVLLFIKKRVENFAPNKNRGPGKSKGQITFIELVFNYEQGGWIGLVFDTRPNAEPDGEYTLYLDDETNSFYMPETSAALESHFDQGNAIDVILLDGTALVINKEGNLVHKDNPELEFKGDFNACVGEMMRKALEFSHSSGLLDSLPLGDPCYFGVEETNGYYAWPVYEKYKTEGKIN